MLIRQTKRELIEGDSHEHIKGARKEGVDGPLSLTVGGDRAEAVKGRITCKSAATATRRWTGPSR